MSTQDQLTDEERAILAFAEADFIKRGLKLALGMVRNPRSKHADIRAVIDYYRDLWRRMLS